MDPIHNNLFYNVVNQSAVACLIITTNAPNYNIVYTNQQHKINTRTQNENIVDKTIAEVFNVDSNSGQYNFELLITAVNKVASEGVIIKLAPVNNTALNASTNQMEQFWWQTTISPIRNTAGVIEHLLITSYNITEQIIGREAIEKSRLDEAALQREQTLNEELTATNEELQQAQESLEKLNLELERRVAARTKELAESENRFRIMVEQAPVAMLVNRGEDLVFDIINQPMIDLIGKGNSIKGKAWYDAIPELKGQPIVERLYHTYYTGQEWTGIEEPIVLNIHGKEELRYYNLTYKPLIEDGIITGVLQSATDVTEQVVARKKVELAEKNLRMATDSAELGTWNINAKTFELTASRRFKLIFGFQPTHSLSYENAFLQIHHGYREKVEIAVKAAINESQIFDQEYPILRNSDSKLRWIRSVGKMHYDIEGKPNFITGILHDITERKLNDIRKNDFIAMVSHELKTPLTSLKAYVHILMEDLAKNHGAVANDAFTMITNQVNKMTTLINSFLNISRLESGKIHLNKTDFLLDELIRDTAKEVALISHCTNIVITPCPPVLVNADYEKIGQVINNLLSNALKYSSKDKPIEVVCYRKNGFTEVMVKDTGIGINASDITRLFERFYRVESEHNQTIPGFGIGLYVCAEIVARHDGNIWAESEPGKGAEFYFTIPC